MPNSRWFTTPMQSALLTYGAFDDARRVIYYISSPNVVSLLWKCFHFLLYRFLGSLGFPVQ